MRLDVTSYNHIHGWQSIFITLSTERCQPLWASAGLPPDVSLHPSSATSISRRFLINVESYYRLGHAGRTDGPSMLEDGVPLAYIDFVAAILRDTFTELAAEYGSDIAESLTRWGLRHFADLTQSCLWSSWSDILMQLRNTYCSLDNSILTPIPITTVERIRPVLDSIFGEDADARELEGVALAARAPVSAEEKYWVTSPDDSVSWIDRDILYIENALWTERSYRAWHQFDIVLSNSEREYILAWARRSLETLNRSRRAIGLRVQQIYLPEKHSSD